MRTTSIARLRRSYKPQPPRLRTPVLSSHRWDGAPYKLESSPIETATLTSPLEDNPYARILSSPSRVDRTTRMLSLPRSLYIKYSLLNGPENDNKALWLVPNVDTTIQTGSSSGYGPNSKTQVMKLKRGKVATVASLELLNDTYNVTGIQDVNWNEDNWYVIESLYLQDLISQLMLDTVDPEISTGSNTNGMVIHLQKFGDVDDNNRHILEMDGSVTEVYLSRLSAKLKHHPLYPKLLESLQSIAHDDTVVIDKKHHKLIDTFIKFISYLE